MSSTPYCAELKPDTRLRQLVVGCGLVSMVTGLVILAGMDLERRWTAAAAMIWLLASGWQLFVITSGYKQIRCLRIFGSGAVELEVPGGGWLAAKLLPGSIVLDHLAWLRIVTAEGCQHRELVRRKSSENEAWRRLQVIWRHLGAGG